MENETLMKQAGQRFSMDKIRVVTPVFPHPRHPERGQFVVNLINVWNDSIPAISVFSPITLGFFLKRITRQPKHLSWPRVTVEHVFILGKPFSAHLPERLGNWLRQINHSRVVSRMLASPPGALIYAQFISAGALAQTASSKTGEPYFVDLGESMSLVEASAPILEERQRVMREAAGVVCVSPRLRDEALELGARPDRVAMIPNQPDRAIFHPRDQAECRRQLGLSPDDFIVLYVGGFSHRKGIKRVDAALSKMRNRAHAAWLGSGGLQPVHPHVVHKGSVGHELLPIWMNAANVLALPTLAEGCCNVIAEALSCGLPTVTSDIEDIRWQVPEEGVILVDPKDTDAIAAALDDLADNPDKLSAMRTALIEKSVAAGEQGGRSTAVLNWMQDLLDRSLPGGQDG